MNKQDKVILIVSLLVLACISALVVLSVNSGWRLIDVFTYPLANNLWPIIAGIWLGIVLLVAVLFMRTRK